MKDFIFWAGFFIAVPLGTIAAVTSRPVRDLVFALLLFGTTQAIDLDINLVSREWYRSMTRGIEVSYLDILAIIVLATAVIVRIQEGERLFWPAGLGCLLAYLFYCCLNVALSEPKLFGLFDLVKIVRGMVVLLAAAYYMRGEREFRLFLWILCVTIAYEAMICLSDRYLFHSFRVSGTYNHPNDVSTFGSMVVPVMVASALAARTTVWKAIYGTAAAMGVVCVLLTVSRTGCMVIILVSAGTLAACTGLRLTGRNIVAATVMVVVMAAMLIKAWGTLAERYSQATVQQYASGDMDDRGNYWRLASMMVSDHPLGVGLNNWSYWVTNEYGAGLGMSFVPYNGTDEEPDRTPIEGRERAQAAFAHTLIGLTLGELGWPGLLLFLAIWLRWFHITGAFIRTQNLVMANALGIGLFFLFAGVFLSNITESSFRLTGLFFLAHIGGGVAAALHQFRTSAALARA